MKNFTISIATLQSEWDSLLQEFQANSEISRQVFQDLVTAYSSADRFYHTLGHIQQVLEKLEPMRSLALEFPIIQLAAWFHDVIYHPKSNDNEEKSADYAEVSLNSLNLPKSTINRIKTLILSTKTHQASPDDIDCQIILDADLAILGASEVDYRAYAQAIRQEYAWVSDERYRVQRKQVLQNLLQRERIYFTELLFLKLEEKARWNIQGEIEPIN
ncbi:MULTISPECIES: hypothetical protein [unclassified Coleofasciculus]|uniref:HD domain-containing protein n=1 Tax=unclassified Coleofasciculus TaxID=2692782 RepID=UPI00187DDABE|nr:MULTISPECIES: hypothetical protein [unclassified Coleofasciculus]MBE9124886.1 hypothetical protein [Coleofasciculus sp. LEGE 07081]MBE9147870.1 hypothetical protein [Coleofasciculus sp. LEGE 07092]